MRKAITQRSGGSHRSPGRGGAPSVEGSEDGEAAALAEETSDEELMSAMQAQWVEVECLLRVQLRSPDALEDARRRVQASIRFDESLTALAVSSAQLKGSIFQALLAFVDGRTESTAASVSCDVGDAEWEELARGSDALRKLVTAPGQNSSRGCTWPGLEPWIAP